MRSLRIPLLAVVTVTAPAWAQRVAPPPPPPAPAIPIPLPVYHTNAISAAAERFLQQPADPERFRKAVAAGGTRNADGTVSIRAAGEGGAEYDLRIDETGRILEAVAVAVTPQPPGPPIAFAPVMTPVPKSAGKKWWDMKKNEAGFEAAAREQGSKDGSVRVPATLPDGSPVEWVLGKDGAPTALRLPEAKKERAVQKIFDTLTGNTRFTPRGGVRVAAADVNASSVPEGSLRQRLLLSGGQLGADGSVQTRSTVQGNLIGTDATAAIDFVVSADERVEMVAARLTGLRSATAGTRAADRDSDGLLDLAVFNPSTATEIYRDLLGRQTGGDAKVEVEMDDGRRGTLTIRPENGRCCIVLSDLIVSSASGAASTAPVLLGRGDGAGATGNAGLSKAGAGRMDLAAQADVRTVRTAGGRMFYIVVDSDGRADLPARQDMKEMVATLAARAPRAAGDPLPADQVSFPFGTVKVSAKAKKHWDMATNRGAFEAMAREQGSKDGRVRIPATLPDGSPIDVLVDKKGEPVEMLLPAVQKVREAAARSPTTSRTPPPGSLRERLLLAGGTLTGDGSVNTTARVQGNFIGTNAAGMFALTVGPDDQVSRAAGRLLGLRQVTIEKADLTQINDGVLRVAGERMTAQQLYRRYLGRDADGAAATVDVETEDGTRGKITIKPEGARGYVLANAVITSATGETATKEGVGQLILTSSSGATAGVQQSSGLDRVEVPLRRLRASDGATFYVGVKPDGTIVLPEAQAVSVSEVVVTKQ